MMVKVVATVLVSVNPTQTSGRLCDVHSWIHTVNVCVCVGGCMESNLMPPSPSMWTPETVGYTFSTAPHSAELTQQPDDRKRDNIHLWLIISTASTEVESLNRQHTHGERNRGDVTGTLIKNDFMAKGFAAILSCCSLEEPVLCPHCAGALN